MIEPINVKVNIFVRRVCATLSGKKYTCCHKYFANCKKCIRRGMNGKIK